MAAKCSKPAKLIRAVEAAHRHDKEFKTNFIPRIANLIGQNISCTKRLGVNDLKPCNGIKGRLNDAFKILSNEMEDAIQHIGQAQKHRTGEEQIIRITCRKVAPPPHYIHMVK